MFVCIYFSSLVYACSLAASPHFRKPTPAHFGQDGASLSHPKDERRLKGYEIMEVGKNMTESVTLPNSLGHSERHPRLQGNAPRQKGGNHKVKPGKQFIGWRITRLCYTAHQWFPLLPMSFLRYQETQGKKKTSNRAEKLPMRRCRAHRNPTTYDIFITWNKCCA